MLAPGLRGVGGARRQGGFEPIGPLKLTPEIHRATKKFQ